MFVSTLKRVERENERECVYTVRKGSKQHRFLKALYCSYVHCRLNQLETLQKKEKKKEPAIPFSLTNKVWFVLVLIRKLSVFFVHK